jgi:hypothetical protein
MVCISEKEEIADTSLGNEFVGGIFHKVNGCAKFLLELEGKDIGLDRRMCESN